jgi:hypothetical protein
MAKSNPNVFSKIFDSVNIFDDLVDLDGSLSGTFKIKRKTNKKGIANVKGTFKFKDDILAGFGFKKLVFKDRSSSSLFGDFSDDDSLGNPRTVRSGNKKFDYSYNGKNSDILNSKNFVGERKKLVELSVFPDFLKTFESKKGKVKKGFFRVNLDDNFAVFGTGNRSNFNDPGNLLMRADFEEAFDLLNPSFDVL